MEEIIFQIYGSLILTLAGFVLPILIIAISVFSEGVKLLNDDSKDKQKQISDNLKKELLKSDSEGMGKKLTKSGEELEKLQRKIKRRLLYLDPNSILLRSTIAIIMSLVLFLGGLFFYSQLVFNIRISVILFIASACFLIWTFIILFNSIKTISEASSKTQERRGDENKKISELLKVLIDVEKEGNNPQPVNQEDVTPYFNGEAVTSGKEVIFSINKEYNINIELVNKSDYFLKMVELGFIFPEKLLITGKSIASTTIVGNKKIIRFKYDYIQSHVRYLKDVISINFLESGIFDISVFVGSENLKKRNMKFKIKVIE